MGARLADANYRIGVLPGTKSMCTLLSVLCGFPIKCFDHWINHLCRFTPSTRSTTSTRVRSTLIGQRSPCGAKESRQRGRDGGLRGRSLVLSSIKFVKSPVDHTIPLLTCMLYTCVRLFVRIDISDNVITGDWFTATFHMSKNLTDTNESLDRCHRWKILKWFERLVLFIIVDAI